MKKFFLFVLLALALAVSDGCASAGYTGLTGLSVPGYEAAGVVAANQAIVATLGAQAVAPVSGVGPYGQPLYATPYGNVPICRPQDIPAGMSPVSQPVVVRVDKTRKHQAKDVFGGAVVGAGLGGLSGGWQGAAYGGAAGAGGGMLVANHEQELCLFLPVRAP